MMAQRISAFLYRVSRGPVVLAAIALFALFIVVVLPRQAAQAEQATGGSGGPDGAFVYTPDDLYGFAEAYGPDGRAAYIRARWTFDVVWPLVYTAFLGTTISFVYARAFAAGSVWRYANLTPVIGAVLDYGENSATSLVMARFPDRTPVVDLLAPVFTFTKWIFVNGSFAVLLVGLVIWLGRLALSRRIA
jgi:hypothetical protein